MMVLVRKQNVRLLVFVTLGLFVREGVVAQVTESEFRRLISVETWSPDDIAKLEKGEAVVHSLPAKDKQELATLGVVRIARQLPVVTLEIFRRSLDQKSEGSMKTGGRFSQPPVLEDLKDLELDDETVAKLQECSLRNCDLNLSASVIGQMQALDWSSPNSKSRATDLIRSVLLAYAENYSTRGVGSLGTYDNRRKVVDLAVSHRALVQNSKELFEIAPEFADYLATYPEAKLSNVENTLHWSIVDFGLKPSITISHAAAYTQITNGTEQFFVAARQIYSSRYLDSSLSFAVLLRLAGGENGNAYLLFIDRSRSDALDGPLGGVARGVVRNDASERVRKMLDKAHIRLLGFAQPEVVKKEDSRESRWFSWAILTFSVIGIALLAVIAFRRRRAHRR